MCHGKEVCAREAKSPSNELFGGHLNANNCTFNKEKGEMIDEKHTP
jgi:hypothetical protein